MKRRVNDIFRKRDSGFFNQWRKRISIESVFFNAPKSFMNTGSAQAVAKYQYGHFRVWPHEHPPHSSNLLRLVNLPRTVNKDCLAWQNSHTVISKLTKRIINIMQVSLYLCINLYRVHISSQSEI